MVIHLIAVARIKGQMYVYHYLADKIAPVMAAKNVLVTVGHKWASVFSIHILKTLSPDFESVGPVFFNGRGIYGRQSLS